MEVEDRSSGSHDLVEEVVQEAREPEGNEVDVGANQSKASLLHQWSAFQT